jgi:hypothetical protein
MLPSLIPRVSSADLTDADFFLESLNSSLFPGVPSSVDVHNGFASEQARYVTRPSSLIIVPHPDKKLTQHRNRDPLFRSADTLSPWRVVRHLRRSLSRRGARASRRRLLPGPTQRKRARADGWLRLAPGRKPGLRQLGRQQPKRPGDAHQQRGGPHPDRARQVLGLPPPIGRGPHHRLGHMGNLPR